MTQDSVFKESEGDAWFERNREKLRHFSPYYDPPSQLIYTYKLKPTKILEVGAANGVRLAALFDSLNGPCVTAVEVSRAAIEDGKAWHKNVVFVQGEISNIPIKDTFDLVIVNFVLHWVSRDNLLRAVAEVDRLLCDGGHLIIGDFYPSNRTKNPYHHVAADEVYTYKQDYSAIFTASGLYHVVGMQSKKTGSLTSGSDTTEHDRVCTWLLKKELNQHYIGG